MDLCGPYPVQGPRGERYFYSVLDDKSNFGFTFGLKQKSDAFLHYLSTEAFLERSNGVRRRIRAYRWENGSSFNIQGDSGSTDGRLRS
jgi:hypothetical protein